jgi:lactoylglutathione lyase
MRLAHTMIRVKDLDAALDFYTGFLGLKEVRRHTIGQEATLVFLTDERERYHLELTYNHGKSDYALGDQFGHLAFHVDDLEAIVKDVEARGWWYRRSRPELKSKYIFVKDPSGYDIEILEARLAVS